MCTMPSTPNSSAAQPITCRPAGPLCSGSRRLRQATKHSSSGTNHASRPTEPATTVRVTVAEDRRAAATRRRRRRRRRARPGTGRPRRAGAPARAHLRCCPTRRTPPPTTWAAPSQTRATAPAQGGEQPVDRRRPAAHRPRRRTLASAQACACWWSSCPSNGIARSSPPSQGCSCCATPSGKTYGSPWWRMYGKTSHAPRVTRRGWPPVVEQRALRDHAAAVARQRVVAQAQRRVETTVRAPVVERSSATGGAVAEVTACFGWSAPSAWSSLSRPQHRGSRNSLKKLSTSRNRGRFRARDCRWSMPEFPV